MAKERLSLDLWQNTEAFITFVAKQRLILDLHTLSFQLLIFLISNYLIGRNEKILS